MESKYPCFVLSLDGGGSKGVYSLGVLRQVEALVGAPLSQKFDLIYGTSTGAIIAAFLALGLSVDEIKNRYFDLIPQVMGHKKRSHRSRELRAQLAKTFGSKKFDSFQTNVGIVATNYDYERPFIFKNDITQAFGMTETFLPGFGCKISDALLASCAAFPFFDRVTLDTPNQGKQELMDGGFVANNPTLFAIADASGSLKYAREHIKVLSVGVGHYIEPQKTWYSRMAFSWWPIQLVQKQFNTNTKTMEKLREIFFSDVACVRVDGSYSDSRYETDMLEADKKKLEMIFGLGRESFAKQELEIKSLLQ